MCNISKRSINSKKCYGQFPNYIKEKLFLELIFLFFCYLKIKHFNQNPFSANFKTKKYKINKCTQIYLNVAKICFLDVY